MKKLQMANAITCPGFVDLIVDNDAMRFDVQPFLPTSPVQAIVQHFRDGTTEVICPYLEKSTCRMNNAYGIREQRNAEKRAIELSDDSTIKEADIESAKCPYEKTLG